MNEWRVVWPVALGTVHVLKYWACLLLWFTVYLLLYLSRRNFCQICLLNRLLIHMKVLFFKWGKFWGDRLVYRSTGSDQKKVCLIILQTDPTGLEPDLGPVNTGSKELSWPVWDDSPHTDPSSLTPQGPDANLAGSPLSSAWIITGIWEGPFSSIRCNWTHGQSIFPKSPYSFMLACGVTVHVKITKSSFLPEVRQGLLPSLSGAGTRILFIYPFL